MVKTSKIFCLFRHWKRILLSHETPYHCFLEFAKSKCKIEIESENTWKNINEGDLNFCWILPLKTGGGGGNMEYGPGNVKRHSHFLRLDVNLSSSMRKLKSLSHFFISHISNNTRSLSIVELWSSLMSIFRPRFFFMPNFRISEFFVPTGRFIRRYFFVARITVKIGVVKGRLDLRYDGRCQCFGL